MEIVDIDGITGIVTKRQATAEEVAIHELETKKEAELAVEKEIALENKAKALHSAQTKLAKLGLTPDEVASILG
jgi:hypothetical protein